MSQSRECGAVSVRQQILEQQQMQQQARSRMRQQKLKITFIGYVIVLILLSLVQFIGIGFFTSGFLLSRNVVPDISECTGSDFDSCMKPAKFDKVVLLVIDALRFDFSVPAEGSQEHYHNGMHVLYDHAQKDNGLLLKFMADPPTTTLQRLKGLTTGSLPTFIDAGSNFNGDAIEEDNWLLQCRKSNKSIAFMGDDTWSALFKEYINPDLHFPYDSLNVWDLDTVDNGVIEHLFPLLDKANSTKWDILIGHFLGVDHVGHRYGPDHFSMKQKLAQMNEVITDVINKISDKTLLVVIGDHGMDSTGNHGGDSLDELESTIFMYSKKYKFNKKDNSNYNITDSGKYYRSVNQIDLVSTISLLLGLPVPFNNLGFPIDEVFQNEKDLSYANFKVVQQIQRFRNVTPSLSSEINEQYEYLVSSFSSISKKKYQQFIEASKRYQSQSLEECKSLWAEFDLKNIIIGIAILFLSSTFLITYSRSIPSVRVSTMSFEFIGSVIAMSLLGLVSGFSIYVVLKPADFSVKACLSLGSAIGIIIGFWAPIMDRFSVNWLWHQLRDFFIYNFNSWSFLGMVFTLLNILIFASNSYIVWEDKMTSFFIISFGFFCLYACLINTKLSRTTRILGVSHAFTFIVISRMVSAINLCREEQGSLCFSTFKTSWWSILLLHVMSLVLPLIIKSFYKLSNSYHSAAPLWIGTCFKFLLFMNAVYWTFEYIQSEDRFKDSFLSSYINLISSFKLALARGVLFVSLVLANFTWSRGPLCVKLDIEEIPPPENSESSEPQRTARILGYDNVYGSSYFLLILNFTIPIMLVNKPLGSLSIGMLLIQILSLLELFHILDIRRNLIAPIIFGLLGFQHFFATGHQATIPSIQWETGFITTESIVFPFTHLNIFLNTFGSFIIVFLAVPLITLWNIKPSNKPITCLSQIITNITTLITYQILTSLSSFVFTAHFRRHLMVWKIFAPRFMLSGLLLIVVNVVLILFSLWFGTGKVMSQVNRIFDK